MFANVLDNRDLARFSDLSRRLVLLLGVLAVLLASGAAVAGESPCASSRATDDLLSCVHCKTIKKLLAAELIGELDMQVHELDGGVIVEIDAATMPAVALSHDLARALWPLTRDDGVKLSNACAKRDERLEECSVDLALTESGALVVVKGENDELIAWLREDANSARDFVRSAAAH